MLNQPEDGRWMSGSHFMGKATTTVTATGHKSIKLHIFAKMNGNPKKERKNEIAAVSPAVIVIFAVVVSRKSETI